MTKLAQSARTAYLDPMVVVLVVGFLNVLMLWSPIVFEWEPTDFFSGMNVLGFVPSIKTLAVYVGGLVLMAAAYLLALLWRGGDSELGYPVGRYKTAAWVAYALSAGANVLAFVVVGGIPLFDLALRQQLDAKLVWLASLQIVVVPLLLVIAMKGPARSRKLWNAWAVAAGLSLALLILTGTRGLPLKYVLAIVITYGALTRVVAWKGLAVGALLVVIFLGAGALTKSQIYSADGGGAPAAIGRSVRQAYADSVGMFFNLQIIVSESDDVGFFGGERGGLLRDTVLNIVPGVDRLYGNYQIGLLVEANATSYQAAWPGFRLVRDSLTSVVPGVGAGTEGGAAPSPDVERPVARSLDLGDLPISQAPTIVGAAYADFGWLGVVAQMLLAGGLLGGLMRLGSTFPALLAFAGASGAYAVAGINLGLHNEAALIMFGLSGIALTLAVIRARIAQERDAGTVAASGSETLRAT